MAARNGRTHQNEAGGKISLRTSGADDLGPSVLAGAAGTAPASEEPCRPRFATRSDRHVGRRAVDLGPLLGPGRTIPRPGVEQTGRPQGIQLADLSRASRRKPGKPIPAPTSSGLIFKR